MAQFYSQPDYTAQAASTYKANLDNATEIHNQVAGGLLVAAQTAPDMTVRYTAGTLQNGTTLTSIATGSTGTITAPVTNPRIDRVVVDQTTGVISVITGTEDASPTAPAITSGKVALAQLALATSTTQITNSLITDERPGIAVFATNDLADLDIDGATAATTADDADTVPIYDDGAGANRKMTRANFLASQPVANIDVAGATDLGATPADTDELLINDGGTNKKVAYSDLMGGAGLKKLLAQTASADTSLDFNSTYITASYNVYLLTFDGVIPATDGSRLIVRMSPDNGSTIRATGYKGSGHYVSYGSTADDNETSTTELLVSRPLGNASGENGAFGYIYLYSAAAAGSKTSHFGGCVGAAADGDPDTMKAVSGQYNTAETHNFVRVLMDAGNITSGTVTLYGVR